MPDGGLTTGRWRRALVTGASSGIGAAFAEQLAAAGTDLILIGRDPSALESVAALSRHHGVRVEPLIADLGDERNVERIVTVLRDADPMVDLLVNNAGLGQYGAFLELPIDGAIEIVRVNDIALVRLTHAAITRMAQAGCGWVIQVSSTASASPGPSQAVYAASKAFVSSFGQAIADEVRPYGVTCTTVLPGYTRTRYFERVGLTIDLPERYWMSAAEVAQLSLAAARAGRPLVIPGGNNRRGVALSAQFPSLLTGRIRSRVAQARRLARRIVRAR
jgi:short-subunit dehydrogenase